MCVVSGGIVTTRSVVFNTMSPRPNVGRIYLGVRLTPDSHSQLNALADEYNTSLSDVARLAISYGLPSARAHLDKEPNVQDPKTATDGPQREKCPECSHEGLRRGDTGDMFSHWRNGDESLGVCPESESVKRKHWER